MVSASESGYVPAKISVFTRNFLGAPGYDLVIRDARASVQDYLDAFNAAIAVLPLERTRLVAPGQNCAGCERCCAERAPLTIIDCLLLSQALGKPLRMPPGKLFRKVTGEKGPGGWDAFFDRFTTVMVAGPVVDIALKRREDGRCIFLDRKTKLCCVYEARPFVCQTFICSPAARRALALREAVVNKGEDELVRLWLATKMVIHQASDPCPDPQDWPPTPFAGKTHYREVLLKDVLPAKLWRKLFAGSVALLVNHPG